MKTLTAEKAAELKARGYTHIASIVKSVYFTEYYHVNSIDDIMANGGKWIPAYRGSFPAAKGGSWHGPCGCNGKHIDWSKTIKKGAI